MSLVLLLVALLALDALALWFGVDTRDRGRAVPW
jgi:sporulation-control protein spo0M